MKTIKHWIFPVIVIVIFFIQCNNRAAVPPELQGLWKTVSFAYKDTYFELKNKSITFYDREGSVEIHGISKIKREMEKGNEWELYTISYQNDDLKTVEFIFYYNSTKNGLIRFKNQLDLVWNRQVTE